MVAKCPFCDSIWVCWNWIHAPNDKLWIHECWNCSDGIWGTCFETEGKVRNGVPHWLLETLGYHLTKNSGG